MTAVDAPLGGTYPPATLTIEGPPPKQAQLAFLFRWLTSLDLLLIAFGRAFVAIYHWVKAFIAVVMTGKYPKDSFDYLTGMLRFNTKLQAYLAGVTATKPSSSMDEDAGYPVHLQVQYTEEIGRARPITNYLMTIVLMICFIPGLILGWIGYFIGYLTVLFTGQYNPWAYEKVVRLFEWQARVSVYQLFMTEVTPPIEYT